MYIPKYLHACCIWVYEWAYLAMLGAWLSLPARYWYQNGVATSHHTYYAVHLYIISVLCKYLKCGVITWLNAMKNSWSGVYGSAGSRCGSFPLSATRIRYACTVMYAFIVMALSTVHMAVVNSPGRRFAAHHCQQGFLADCVFHLPVKLQACE